VTRAIVAAAVCFVAGVALYPVLITILARAGAGQMVQAYNPASHRAKAGTPTMGGILFCLFGVAVWLATDRTQAGFVIAFALVGGAAAGFLDDLANVRGLGSLGLRVRQKLVLQIVVGVAVGFGLHAVGAPAQALPLAGMVKLGWAIVPLSAIAVVATTNAVNLTDGVDGLAGSCVALALVGAIVASLWLGAASAATLSAALVRQHELRADAMPGTRIALAWLFATESGIYWHDGATGGYSSFAFFNPKGDYAAVVLLNTSIGQNGSFADRLGRHIGQRLAGKPAISLAN